MAQSYNITIALAGEGDWKGIYVNGKLQYENHNIDVLDTLQALGLKYTLMYFPDGAMEDFGGRFPDDQPMDSKE